MRRSFHIGRFKARNAGTSAQWQTLLRSHMWAVYGSRLRLTI